MFRSSRRSTPLFVLTAILSATCSAESPVEPGAETRPATGTPSPRAAQAVPGEFIVIFRDDRPIPPGLARTLAGDLGLTIRHEYQHAIRGFAARVPAQAMAGLQNNPFVERIEPNLVHALETPPPPPVDVPLNGLRVRLVGDDLTPGDVASWTNRGSDGTALQANASRQPTAYGGLSSFAGHVAVGFNEGADDDEVLEIPGVAPHTSATVIGVLQQESSDRHNYGFAAMYGGGRSRAGFVTRQVRGSTVDYWDSSSHWSDGTLVLDFVQPHVVVWRVVGGDVVEMFVDGGGAGSGRLKASIPGFDRYLLGMTEPSTGARFDGQVAELLIYDRALPDCELSPIVADLGTQYAIPVGPIGGSCAPPTDPGSLAAAAAGFDAIDLEWTSSSNETGYRVERRLGQAGTWEALAETGPDETVFADRGLSSETEYCYRVQAFNDLGSSNWTTVACATTGATLPLPPAIDVPTEGLRLRLVADDLPTGDVASWTNRGSESDAVQSDASRRPVYVPSSSEFGGHAAVGFNEGADDDEALIVPAVAHHGSGTLIAVFRQEGASGHNYGIFGAWGGSSSRAGMVTRASSTGGPLDYWDSSNGWVRGDITISENRTYVGVWRIDAGDRAELQIDGADAGSTALGTGFPGFDRYVIGMTEPNTSTRFDGRVAEILFYDRVLPDCELDPIVAELGGQYGVTVSASGGGCEPPIDPSGLAATAVGADAIDLSWTDGSTNEAGFRVERRIGQAGAWEPIGETSTDQTVYADRGLASETEYCYRVQAFNGFGDSNWTSAACAVTDETLPVPPPIDVPTEGLRVRLVANDLPDGEVATWPNRGSEGDAAQSDASRRPVHVPASGAFGGNAAVGFNEGSDDDEALIVPGVTPHGSGTLIAVFRQEDAAGHNYGIFGPWGSSSSRAGMVTRASSTGGPVDYWDSSNGWVRGSTVVSANRTYVGAWRIEGGIRADLSIDGAPAGSTNIASAFPGFDRYVIGMTEPNTSTRFDGQIAELLFYDRALPSCELDLIVAGLGDQYGVAVSVTGGGCEPPADPTGLSVTTAGYSGIDLAWTDASTNESGFRIERRTGQTGTWEQIAETAADVSAFASRNLVPETEYCYRVQAFKGEILSAFSNIACATTEAAPVGACIDTGNHDDLADLYGIVAVGAPNNQVWASTQVPGCEIVPWYFGLDSGVDSDHPDLNVIEAASFVAAEPNHDGEDRNGHGTHTAGSAAARDGNGGVVGVAPGARIHSFRVCEDGGSCQTADMVAAMDEVVARKFANPTQPMVANMSIGGPADNVVDEAIRNSINAGIVYAVAAGNGILGACIFPNDAANVSPARVGDDEIAANGSSFGNDGLINGVLTTTSHNASFSDVNCNYGAPVSVAAPGFEIRSTWLNGAYNTISGTSMATPHAAGAALLYLQSFPDASPAEVEAAIVGALKPWSTNESPNASGRLSVEELSPLQTAAEPDGGTGDTGADPGAGTGTGTGNGNGNGGGNGKGKTK